MEMKCIAQNIKYFRNKKELTQLELAEIMKVSRSVVAKWESNLVTPDISSLLKLSAIFDITLDCLVGNTILSNELLESINDIYPSSKSNEFDDKLLDLVHYIISFPKFKNEVYRLKKLSVNKQRSLHKLLSDIIDQYEKL